MSSWPAMGSIGSLSPKKKLVMLVYSCDLSPGKWVQEGQTGKVIFSYILSLGSARAV